MPSQIDRAPSTRCHHLVACLVEEKHAHRRGHEAEERRISVGRAAVKVEALGAGLDHRAPAAGHLGERVEKKDEAPADEHGALHGVSPHHRDQAALNGVERNQYHHHPEDDEEIPPHQLSDGQAAAVEDRDEKDDHVRGKHHPRVDIAAERSEAAVEEISHRRHAVAQVDWDEQDDQQRVRRQRPPFPVGDDHSQVVGGAGSADDLLAGDTGRDERRPDDPPGQLAGGEKIPLGRLVAPARRPHADRDDDRE